MSIDHSMSYKGFGIRAFSHRHRLKSIFKEMMDMNILEGESFCDLGCSNGYITSMIHRKFGFGESVGFDYEAENLKTAKSLYRDVEFQFLNLNAYDIHDRKFNIVTCFETLEHVGNLEAAVKNILSRISPGGKALITVPIEHGLRGFFKYVVKKFVFRYSVSELKISEMRYFHILFRGRRLSESRPTADGYGTHFGFDYRDVDDLLSVNGAIFKAYNIGMTRFYRITG